MTYITPCPFTDSECKMIRNTTKGRGGCKLKLQEIKAREICTQAGLQFDNIFEPEDIKNFERVCNVKIVVYDFKLDCLYDNKNNTNPREIYIILNSEKEHFQFVITKMNAFLGEPYYYKFCRIGYSHKEQHKCKNTCQSCKSSTCNQNGTDITCVDCNRDFQGEKCFENHKYTKSYIDKTTKEESRTLSTCDRYKKCPDCDETSFRRIKSKEINHKCGYRTCSNCNDYTNLETHECFIQKKHLPKNPKMNEKLAFWDVEAYQESRSNKHIPYLILATDFAGNKFVFGSIDDFCSVIFNNEKWKAYTFIAHFVKGYDHQFVLELLLTKVNMTSKETDSLNRSKINVIKSGLKLMKIEYDNRKFIDSFDTNFV